MTGESVPVDKDFKAINWRWLKQELETETPKKIWHLMNSNVTYGRGEGIVVGTGMNTEVGGIA